MTVTDCSVATQSVSADEAASRLSQVRHNEALSRICTLSAICNAGEFDVLTASKPLEERTIIGDATDQAVLRFSETLGSYQVERKRYRKDFEIPFNSKNKFMIRVFSSTRTSGSQIPSCFLSIKGAPDILLGRCDSLLEENGSTVALDAAKRADITRIKDEWSAAGKRVILIAEKKLTDEEQAQYNEESVFDLAVSGLTLVGLLGIVEPPRPEIPDVVSTLRRAGVRVFMVTGDFQLTAIAIARMCGIVTTNQQPATVSALNDSSRSSMSDARASEKSPHASKTSIVLSGADLPGLYDEQWDHLCTYDEIVFARTTPEQKLRIVEEFQKRRNVVAMTGDGVNGAPSLKAANVGVALHGGSDIAIEAADMVLLDSFAGIVQAVLYGRVIFDNLKKAIIYLLSTGSFSEFWPVFTNIVFGLPQILTSFLMIAICCLSDCAGAIALAFEKPEADLLLRKPRSPWDDKLVDWRLLLQAYGFTGVILCTTSFAMAYWYAQRRGVPFSTLWRSYGSCGDLDPDFVQQVLNEASSIYFVNLVITQFFNLFAVRTRRLSLLHHPPVFRKATQNIALFPAVTFGLVMIFIWLYIPGLQRTINSTSVPVEYLFFPVAFGMGLLVIDEGRKYAVRRWPDGLLTRMAW